MKRLNSGGESLLGNWGSSPRRRCREWTARPLCCWRRSAALNFLEREGRPRLMRLTRARFASFEFRLRFFEGEFNSKTCKFS